MKPQHGFTLIELLVVVLGILGICGYILNILKIAAASQNFLSSIDVFLMLRILGIFAPPLGAILGYVETRGTR